MSKKTITIANWGMRKQLEELWSICFGESGRPVSYYFNNRFQPENCLLYKVNDEIAAMVHLLPAHLAVNRRAVRAHYIYAAATLPKFRSNGCMAALLKCAAYVGEKRGDRYSVLLPASDSLYGYYGRFGYAPCCKARFLTLSAEQLHLLAGSGTPKNRVLLGYQQMAVLRSEQICEQNGSVLWDAQAVAYADGINKLYDGRLICSKTDGRPAYALCRPNGEQCEIMELMADSTTFPSLAAQILAYVPAKNYRLRLPDNGNLFAGQGEILKFGMAKPLGSIPLEEFASFEAPYMGLTLD